MQGLESIKKLGRGGDTELAHLRPGELVVPPEVLEKYKGLRESLEKKLKREGFEYSSLVVGDEDVIINPRTGLPEFGLFSKLKKSVGRLWKKVKKVVDPVARVAQFIPGPLQPFAAIYNKGKSAINLAQGKGGLGDLLTLGAGGKSGIFGTSGALSQIQEEGLGNLLEGIPGTLQKGISSLINSPLDSLRDFGQSVLGAYGFGGQQDQQNKSTDIGGGGMFGNLFSGQGSTQNGGLGRFLDDVLGIDPSGGGIFGSLKDSLDPEKGGIDPKFAALATAYGAAAKKAAEKERGGLQDIRVNLRPDLQQQTFSSGFDLGLVPVNQQNSFAQGGQVIGESDYAEGGKVLDMRAGGESIGPGTGTSDDIPAMLSDGEFVMTAKANMGAGSLKLNKKKGGIMELVPSLEPDRKRGANNMMKLMRYFEGVA
ncbi:MAG: hypothetical protein CMI74_01800 [Candidatus Pelagibacter sp.]|nr:hypothetical protein [Candidatus Pelagibacter sp.]|tara:strand:+ start:3273 stop:4547 length:1275 start_codon:yes stop_codon:yes gene_type:complete